MRMTHHPPTQWLLVLLVPYLAIGAITLGAGLVLLPLGGTLGIACGLFSADPYATVGFKSAIATACLACITTFAFGFRHRSRLWGKSICSTSVHVWCITGIIGFGQQ